MATFNNLNDLFKHINSQMADVMQKEISEKVKDVEQKNIDSTVYDAYSPFVYERRRDNDGLRDRNNMQSQVTQSGNGVELTVENTTKGKDSNYEIAELIEYGDGTNGKEYDFKRNRDGTAFKYLGSRPFTKNTVDELYRTGEHVDEMKKGLKKRGIDVE